MAFTVVPPTVCASVGSANNMKAADWCNYLKHTSRTSHDLIVKWCEYIKTNIHRGYYTAARRYDFYLRVVKTIFYERAQWANEIVFLTREDKSHIFKPPCNVLFIIQSQAKNCINTKSHVIYIFTSEDSSDMENITLCIFQYLTLYYIIKVLINYYASRASQLKEKKKIYYLNIVFQGFYYLLHIFFMFIDT
jgi:hypothetical protein